MLFVFHRIFQLACKYTNLFSYTQAHACFFVKKVRYPFFAFFFFVLLHGMFLLAVKMRRFSVILFAVALLIWGVSCSRPAVPKPYGYFRIALPEHIYHSSLDLGYPLPCSFAINTAATIVPADSANRLYFNILYPSLNATIHCSYLLVQGNLAGLLDDAQEMVYSHAIKASAIPEQEYADPDHRVWGLHYELQGNTATPEQFYLTDSLHHFLRAAVYINTIPNQDSLAPVVDFLQADVRELIESFRWLP